MRSVVLTALFLATIAFSVSAQPSMDIRGNRFSFGTVPQNVTVTQYFWFVSTGTDTIRITDLKTGCDCATMPLEKKWIAPGDSMLVGLHWNIENRNGGIGRYPYIMTNAGEEPYRIYLTAEASHIPDSIYPVGAMPYIWTLAKTATTTIDSISFRLVNRSDKDVTVRLVSHSPDQVVFQLPTEIKAKSEATGYVRVKPEFANSEFAESITLLTDDARESRFTIPIVRKIYGKPAGTK